MDALRSHLADSDASVKASGRLLDASCSHLGGFEASVNPRSFEAGILDVPITGNVPKLIAKFSTPLMGIATELGAEIFFYRHIYS